MSEGYVPMWRRPSSVDERGAGPEDAAWRASKDRRAGADKHWLKPRRPSDWPRQRSLVVVRRMSVGPGAYLLSAALKCPVADSSRSWRRWKHAFDATFLSRRAQKSLFCRKVMRPRDGGEHVPSRRWGHQFETDSWLNFRWYLGASVFAVRMMLRVERYWLICEIKWNWLCMQC